MKVRVRVRTRVYGLAGLGLGLWLGLRLGLECLKTGMLKNRVYIDERGHKYSIEGLRSVIS